MSVYIPKIYYKACHSREGGNPVIDSRLRGNDRHHLSFLGINGQS